MLPSFKLSLCLSPSRSSFSSSFKEEPSDVREEEPHLRLCHGIHYQRHAHRGQSDAEERHGVAAPTVSGEPASLHVHASGWGHIPVDRKRTTGNNTRNNHRRNPFLKLYLVFSNEWRLSTRRPMKPWSQHGESWRTPPPLLWQGHTRADITHNTVCFPDAIKKYI